tara:strand:- start:22310 stop:22447 length:138 start_codon:yes stop_codon:yes gene_type:complete
MEDLSIKEIQKIYFERKEMEENEKKRINNYDRIRSNDERKIKKIH